LFLVLRRHRPTPFPYTTLFRSYTSECSKTDTCTALSQSLSQPSDSYCVALMNPWGWVGSTAVRALPQAWVLPLRPTFPSRPASRSEEHTSELQSRFDIVCRLLL